MGRLDDLVRKRLADLRAQRGLTQGKVGDAVGWSQTSVSKFELGDFSADLDTLARFAEFYEVPLAELLSTDGPTKPPDPQWQALRAAFEMLTAPQRDALLVMLQAAAATRPRPSGPARRSVRRGRKATAPPKA